MGLVLAPVNPSFAAEASGVDLRSLDDAAVRAIDEAMDKFAVLFFRGQPLTQVEQVALAKKFGPLDAGLRKATGAPTRFQHDELIDIGNVALDGEVAESSDQKLIGQLANQLWHSDSSFQDLPVKYSMLSAVTVPGNGGQTEWCDLRAAWDELPDETKRLVEGRTARHFAFHSRIMLGDDKYNETQLKRFPPVERPLVHVHPGSGRKVLFPSAHIDRVSGMTVPEGRLLVAELLEHATQPKFVYRHTWRAGDYVMWDNRATLHRGRRYDLKASAGFEADYDAGEVCRQPWLTYPLTEPKLVGGGRLSTAPNQPTLQDFLRAGISHAPIVVRSSGRRSSRVQLAMREDQSRDNSSTGRLHDGQTKQ